MKLFSALLSCEEKQRTLRRKQQKRWSKGGTTIFSVTERKTSIRKHFSMSDEESHGARKRMRKITSGVLIVFVL